MIQSERRLKDKTEYETRYYISSLPSNAQKLCQSVRKSLVDRELLYWVLDLAFNEDACRIRKDFAPENLAVLRHIALNLLTRENTLKLGIKNKRLRAGWDEDYLLKILLG
jgi:predicted transposase YbfD/YdcC